ncbi:MAG: transporter [Nanoarchaeota archaeon]
MKTSLERRLRTVGATLSLCTALATSASADDITKGVRGPTPLQLDDRVSYSQNEKGVQSFGNTLILKYWDGNQLGKWMFASLPYRYVSSPTKETTGFGDLTLGGGPRGRIGNLHFLSYGALTLPTGAEFISAERTDLKLGTFVTYLTLDKKFEIDKSFEYTLTGETPQHVNPPNEFAFGFVVGRQITEKIKFAVGLTHLLKEDALTKEDPYLTNLRIVGRYTPSPTIHFETIIDVGIKSHELPKGKSVTVLARYNF